MGYRSVEDQELPPGAEAYRPGPPQPICTVANADDWTELLAMLSGAMKISVKSYGAVGDGVHDDTDMIQACLDENAGVYVPAGLYLCRTLMVPAGVSIQGEGPRSVIRLASGTNAHLMHVVAATEVHISYLALDGNGDNQTANINHNLLFDACTDCGVDHIYSHNSLGLRDNFGGSGVRTWNDCRRITVTKSRFATNETDIDFTASSHCKAIDNYSDGAARDSIVSYETSGGTGLSHHNTISLNHITNSPHTAISLQRSAHNIVTGNIIDNAGFGIQVYGSTQYTHDSIIADNELTGGPLSTGYGLSFDEQTHDNLCEGNKVIGWIGYPIYVGAPENTVKGNRVRDCADAVYVGASGNKLEGNNIKRSGTQGIWVTNNLTDVQLRGNTVKESAQEGILVSGILSGGSAICGNTVLNNSQLEATSYDGIYFTSEGAPERVLMEGNVCTDTQAVKTQRKGLAFPSGSVILLGLNDFTGNASATQPYLDLPDTGVTWRVGDYIPNPVPDVGGYRGSVCVGTAPLAWEGTGYVGALQASDLPVHAYRHETGEADELTPGGIGASVKDHAYRHESGGNDPLTPAGIGASAKPHGYQHLPAGSDPIE